VVTGTLNAVDPDGDTLSYTLTTAPGHGSVVINPDGTYTYTPNQGYLGADGFTVTVSDADGGFHVHGVLGVVHDVVAVFSPSLAEQIYPGGGDTVAANVAVTVTRINHAPVAGPSGTPSVDHVTGAVTGSLGFTDPDGDSLTYRAEALNGGGALVLDPDGTYTYIPTQAARLLAAEAPASATFTVTASDGRVEATTTITVPIDPVQTHVTDVATVGGLPSGVVVGADGRHIYVTNGVSVSEIDVVVGDVFVLGAGVGGVGVSPDGGHVYVANSVVDEVWVIGTDASGSVAIRVGDAPHGVVLSSDGARVYVANFGDGTVSVIDAATNAVTATITVGFEPHAVAVSPDGTRVYVTNSGTNTVSVIDTATNSVTATIVVGSGPNAVVVSPDGGRVYVANFNGVSVIDTATNVVVATVTDVGGSPRALAVSPDGSVVYVASRSGVALIDTATNTAPLVLGVGGFSTAVAVSSDGTEVYVTKDDGTVSVITIT
jgi:YVTN family beta-propeller protein/VCBS repeat-containing protein